VDSYSDCTWGVISTLLPSRSMMGSSSVEDEGRTCTVHEGPHAGAR